MSKIKLTSSERKEIFRPNVILQRLDNQESKFIINAMVWVYSQAENIAIQYGQGVSVDNLILNPNAVRGLSYALAGSMIDACSMAEVSLQNELLHAEQIHQAKLNGTYTPNIVPFAAMREDELASGNMAFYPEAGVDWYRDYTLRLMGVHSVDALEYTKKVIANAIENGFGQTEVMNEIRQQFPQFSKHRLETIARTETAKIYEQARYQQMNADAEVVGYEFAAVMDSRTSEICASHDGKIIRKGQEEGWVPPLHFNCRSVLLPVFAWEEDIQYSIPSMVMKPLPGFGSTEMVIPETARNAIYIGGIPEIKKSI